MKKIFSGLLSITIIVASLFPSFGTIQTAQATETWTIEKAEHLAKRALFAATQDQVLMLYSAGSAENAVNLLFQEPLQVEKDKFAKEVVDFKKSMNITSIIDNRELYFIKIWRNPEEARAKLFTLFEDVFSVANRGNEREFLPLHQQWHNVIYDGLDKHYKNLAKKTFTHFSQAKYLNLLNTNKNHPNQDFARELLQLFLMDEYHPLDTKRTGTSPYTSRNFSENDMESLSFLLTGMRQNKNSRSGIFPENVITFPTDFPTNISEKSAVYFDPTKHNTTVRQFLGESVKVNTAQGETPEVVIDYIFEKREQQIANFIAWKLLKFYITTTPTIEENNWAADIVIQKNFNVLEASKAILKSDKMYTTEHMNEFRYKNPLENVIGTLKFSEKGDIAERSYNCVASGKTTSECIDPLQSALIKYQQATSNIYTPARYTLLKQCLAENKTDNECLHAKTHLIYFSSILSLLDFYALNPPSIFGREGMDNNKAWNNASIYSNAISYVLPRIFISERFSAKKNELWENTSFKYRINNNNTLEDPEEYITRLESYFLQGETLEENARTILIDEVRTLQEKTDVNPMSDGDLDDIIMTFFAQPEYLSLSGSKNYSENIQYENIDSNHVLVLHWLSGGPDFMHMIVPTQDSNYEAIKGNMKIPDSHTVPLIDKSGEPHPLYRLNKGLTSFTKKDKTIKGFDEFYKEGNLYIFQGVANTEQSYAHNFAREAMETGGNGESYGYIKKIFKEKNIHPSQVATTTVTSPILKGIESMQIPHNKVTFRDPDTATLVKKSFNAREKNPGGFSIILPQTLQYKEYFEQNPNVKISTMPKKMEFFKDLIRTKGSKILVSPKGGFDSHKDQDPAVATQGQKKGIGVRNRWKEIVEMHSEFFDTFKTDFPNKDVSIVLYSEFGRTVSPNKTDGTDHGRGGVFFVLTTKPNLLFSDLPQLMGRVDTKSTPLNNQPTQIDVKSIWNRIFTKIYGVNVFKNETTPLELAKYKKFDFAYDSILKARNIPSIENIKSANSSLVPLAILLSNNNFFSAHYKKRFEVIKNGLAQSISIPENPSLLFSEYSFQNNLGDSSSIPLSLHTDGNFTPQYLNGYRGKGLLLSKNYIFHNDQYGYYSQKIKSEKGISSKKQTISGWIKPEKIEKDSRDILLNQGNGVRILLSNTGTTGKKLKVYFTHNNQSSIILDVTNPKNTEIRQGQWAHFALTIDVDAKTIKFFLNGNLITTKTDIQNLLVNHRFTLGEDQTGTQKRHEVILDEVKIVGKALSNQEARNEFILEHIRTLEQTKNNTLYMSIKNKIDKLANSNPQKQNLLNRANAYKKNVSKYTGSIPDNINSCIALQDNWFPDKTMEVKWNGKSLFTDKTGNKEKIKEVFTEGFDNGNIKWSYNKKTKTYIFSFHASDDPLWNCYIKENNFFKDFFTVQ